MDRRVMTSLGEVEVLEQLRVRAQDLYPEVVERYVAALERGDRLPDLLVARLGDRLLLLDGRHRIAAWEAAGVPIVARVGWRVADMGEALERAMAANTRHGEPPRFGDVTRCVELALGVWPDLSAREIARRVGCSHTLVNRVKEAQTLARVETVSTQEAPAPEFIPDEDGYPIFNIHNERPEVDPHRIILKPYQAAYSLDLPIDETEDTRDFRLAVGVDFGTTPATTTQELALPDGRYIWPGETTPQTISSADRMTELWGEEEDLIAPEAPVVEDEGPKGYRGKDALERWYTPPDLAAACWRWLVDLDVLPEREVWTVLEPAVGDGAWWYGANVVSLERKGLERLPQMAWDSCDLDGVAQRPSELRARGVVGDFLEVSWPDPFDLVITNPPNSKAFELVRRALELVVPGGVVAFLMPLSWIAARGRRAWLEEHPPYRVGVCPWRPSFGGPAAELQGTGNGTPTQVYAMFVWMAGHKGETVLEIIPGGEVGDGEE